MNVTFLLEQFLNGLGYGLMLFMMAAGLTLVLGIMDFLNLAHGSLYMLGGYVAASVQTRSNSFVLAVASAVLASIVAALILETTMFRRLYDKGHLVQMVATFGLALVADDAVKLVWGAAPLLSPMPSALDGSLQLLPGLFYPTYRLVVLLAGIAFAVALYILVNQTRLGMLVRAGASNRLMTELMGVRVDRVFITVFVIGAILAAAAGALMGPIGTVQAGMGQDVLIPALVVIVIGGIGSVRGAFVASLLVGFVDTAGRAFLTPLLRLVASPSLATDIGPSLASIAMYVLMALVLSFKPTGLFPART
jgi:branched-chain amino acid transport system permease protein